MNFQIGQGTKIKFPTRHPQKHLDSVKYCIYT